MAASSTKAPLFQSVSTETHQRDAGTGEICFSHFFACSLLLRLAFVLSSFFPAFHFCRVSSTGNSNTIDLPFFHNSCQGERKSLYAYFLPHKFNKVVQLGRFQINLWFCEHQSRSPLRIARFKMAATFFRVDNCYKILGHFPSPKPQSN